ncbi:hypothetical protein ACSBR1_006331 [Camellia fascicularis]
MVGLKYNAKSLTCKSSTFVDLEQILQEAQHRWLRLAEICEVLRNHEKFHLTPEPLARPPGAGFNSFKQSFFSTYIVCPQEAEDEQDTSKGKRGRGKSRSLKLAKLKNQGVRLPIQICKVSGRPYGEASKKFTSELGIVTRQFSPQNVPSWTDISEEDKETLTTYLQGSGFKFTNEPYAIESILNLMHDLYKTYRHDLRQHFRSFPTMESALADPPENMEKEVWRFLCEKWSDKDYKVLQACVDLKLRRSLLDFECHFNEVLENKMR